jgi:CTP-dependent riboflavin kinase
VALILPLRSHYTDIIELIAPQNLRESLGLKDGDLVHVEVRV